MSKRSYLLLALLLLCACGGREATAAQRDEARAPARTLTLAAYTVPEEAYGEIIPLFRRHWKTEHDEDIEVHTSFEASVAQARAVIGGFEADIVALSLEQDVQKVADAGLITHDFRSVGGYGGIVTSSIVILAVRQGNPKNIRDWSDLRREDVDVITANVRTSGGAMWNIAGAYGAALRGHAGEGRFGDGVAAERFLAGLLARVRTMDRSGRESMNTFDRGRGDVAITYENELMLAITAGRTYEEIVPTSTLLIENPIALVDRNVALHRNRDIAEAFLDFITSEEAQRVFARYGFRPVDEVVRRETAGRFPHVEDLFTVRDFGGWSGLERSLFGRGAAYDRAVASLDQRRR